MFAELPSIDNITVQNEQAWGNTLYICQEFFGATGICSQMDVGHNNYIDSAFLHSEGFTKIDIVFKLIFKLMLSLYDEKKDNYI